MNKTTLENWFHRLGDDLAEFVPSEKLPTWRIEFDQARDNLFDINADSEREIDKLVEAFEKYADNR